MYIGYDVKGGIRYAKLCVSERVDGKVRTTQKSLGRVLDEGKHIYQSRERGVFTYDLATGEYGKPDPSDIPSVRRWNHRESLILDFGDAYLIDKVIDGFGLYKATDAMDYGNNDSVRAMLMFYILSQSANCYAQDWYDGSYARILFPKANLESQRISDILSAIGDEWSYREFFKEYLPLVANAGKDGEDVLIDSTGLPNSIHFPLTAVSNHNGEISNEVRLIYVVQKKTNLPLFFRYVPGNVVDVSTLTKTIRELKSYNIDTKFATLDAGYLTDTNMRELYDGKVSFVSRLKENRRIYKTVAERESHDLEEKGNLVEYNSRYVYVKRVKVEVLNPNAEDRILGPDERPSEDAHAAYVYLCRDMLMKSLESGKLFASAKSRKLSPEDVHDGMESQGNLHAHLVKADKEGGHPFHLLHEAADRAGVRPLQEQHEDAPAARAVGRDLQGASPAFLRRIGHREAHPGEGEEDGDDTAGNPDRTQEPEVQGVRQQHPHHGGDEEGERGL
jgi:hypothetical protein